MPRWPDVEAIAVAYLRVALGTDRVATKVPGDLSTPFVRVLRGPGTDDGISDGPLLDVDAFAPNQPAASDLAEDARQALHALSNKVVNGALVDNVTTATGPVRVAWGDNSGVERYVASYRLTLRLQ